MSALPIDNATGSSANCVCVCGKVCKNLRGLGVHKRTCLFENGVREADDIDNSERTDGEREAVAPTRVLRSARVTSGRDAGVREAVEFARGAESSSGVREAGAPGDRTTGASESDAGVRQVNDPARDAVSVLTSVSTPVLQSSASQPMFQCQHCVLKFSTKIGQRQHEKQGHPKEYNTELEIAAMGARKGWTETEVRDLATMEVQYGADTKGMLDFMVGQTERSKEAIKGRRKMESYKRLMGKIPLSKLEILYNAMVYLQYTPIILRKSRTILIPKCTENLESVDNWRPITISSLLLRTFSRLYNTRLNVILSTLNSEDSLTSMVALQTP